MSLSHHLQYCLLLVELIGLHRVAPLRLALLDIPPTTIVGDTIEMSCLYELFNNDSLYAVKWYKNDQEFFRFVPEEGPIGQYLKMDGVRVDLENSNHQTVILKDISLKSTGNYRCEVSIDAPTFVTLSAEKYMFVYALPNEGPVISGHQRYYKQGDLLNVNCTASESKPAAILGWVFDGKIHVDVENQRLSANDKDSSNTNGYLDGITIKRYVAQTNHLPRLISTITTPTITTTTTPTMRSKNVINRTVSNQLMHSMDNTLGSPLLSNADRSKDAERDTISSKPSVKLTLTENYGLESSISNLQISVDEHLFEFFTMLGYKAQLIDVKKSIIDGAPVSIISDNDNNNKLSIASSAVKSGEKPTELGRRLTQPITKIGQEADTMRRLPGLPLKIKCIASITNSDFYTMSDVVEVVILANEQWISSGSSFTVGSNSMIHRIQTSRDSGPDSVQVGYSNRNYESVGTRRFIRPTEPATKDIGHSVNVLDDALVILAALTLASIYNCNYYHYRALD